MALAQYGTLITTIGLAQIANAQITQTKVGLEYIALGDGNGAHYVPTQNQTALVHEVWRGPIAELSIDPTNNNRIIIDAVIPVTAGGFTIREIGIFDDKNQLIAIGQYPEKYKPQLSEGVSEETLIHFVIETNNADVVKLNIDPTVIIATRKYVDAKVADAVGNIGTDLTELKTKVTTHLDEIASTEKLGHIKVDGKTIKVDPVTGITSSLGGIPFVEAVSTDGINYSITLDDVAEYKKGMLFTVQPSMNNTGSVKLNINGIGAILLTYSATGLVHIQNTFTVDGIYTVSYTGKFFVLVGDGFGLTNTLASQTHVAPTVGLVKQVNDKHIQGIGSPEGQIVAPIGTLYTRTDIGTATTTLYVKTSGVGNTGWTAK